jgi:TRL-like protein family
MARLYHCPQGARDALDEEKHQMKMKLVTAALLLVALNGCAMASGGNAAALGTIYSSYKSPGQLGTAADSKTGEACISSILGIVATGDGSIETAKKAGGITQISHIDHEQFSVVGVYATSCTIVHGS